MPVINATILMVAFYDDHPYTIASLAERVLPGDAPHHPFSREQTVFEGMTLVFPALRPLILPIHTIHTGGETSPVPFDRARYKTFKRWEDIRGEDPSITLVAIDDIQHSQVHMIVWQWQERRFPTIIWSYRLEDRAKNILRYGGESQAHYETIYFTLHEPGWERGHQGYVRFAAATLKAAEIHPIEIQLTQHRNGVALNRGLFI